MKLLKKISSIAVVLFFANHAIATSGNPSFTIKSTEEKILYFEAKSLTLKDFEIKIRDKKGVVIFSEYGVNPENFKRRYNLSELKNGEYFLYFETETEIQVLPISIENDEMNVDFSNLKVTEKEIVG